jgi:CDP-4-dehydro-6-deoxyglucose reductase
MNDDRNQARAPGSAVIERGRAHTPVVEYATDDEGGYGAATLVDKSMLAADIMQVTLQVDDRAFAGRRPGQYLSLLGEDGSPRHFSIASPPDTGPRIELHVRRVAGGMFTSRLCDELPVGSKLRVSGPFGDLVPRDGTAAMLLVAGGSGFAPMQAITAHVLSRQPHRAVTLLWSVRRPDDLYKREMLEAWAHRHPGFRFLPVIDTGVDTGAANPLQERLAMLAAADQDTYISGPPPMVALCRNLLAGLEIAANRIHFEGSSNLGVTPSAV